MLPTAIPLPIDRDPPPQGWRALDEALAGARVVVLGEQSHGDGNAFALKAALVRHLHLDLGFDVLAMEACFYSLARAWTRASTPEETRALVPRQVYHHWREARETQPLWDLVAERRASERPLIVAGVDPRHAGPHAHEHLLPDLEAFLARHAPGALEGEAHHAFRGLLEDLLAKEYEHEVNALHRTRFLGRLRELRDTLEDVRGEEAAFWRQELRNLAWTARNAWSFEGRDQGMGENLVWLARERFPDKKIVVWTHNWHAVKSRRAVEVADAAYARGYEQHPDTPMGEVAARALGPDLYALALIAGRGEELPHAYRRDYDTRGALPAPPAGSLEAALLDEQHDTAFLDLRRSHGEAFCMSGLERGRWTELPWREVYDGVLFQRTMRPITVP